MIPALDPSAVAAWQADPAREPPVLVDVRQDWERDICAIAGSQPLPMHELQGRLGELPKERDLVIVCHTGQRSAMVTMWLRQQGYAAHNLEGGVEAWARTVDPAMRRY
ncbi:MAG: rhodanese-like domain-containing protein [Betaproteobacteria bacterium]